MDIDITLSKDQVIDMMIKDLQQKGVLSYDYNIKTEDSHIFSSKSGAILEGITIKLKT